MYTRTKLSVLLAFIPMLLLQCNYAYSVSDRFVVVIDAGHGGTDPGAVYSNYKEKDINLSVALKLGQMIQDSFPEIRVIYTRMTDVFVGLNERSSLSNRVRANLFISIHSNSAKSSSPRGMETYIMGMEKSSENLRVAMLENSVITQEEGYGEKYEGYDPSCSESFIIFSLQQHAFQTESLRLASEIQKQYVKSFAEKTVDKGVKQANFLVLWRTTCPSVLTEIGFLSNSIDRAFITSKVGQNSIARSLYTSVIEYYKQCHTTNPTPPVIVDTVVNTPSPKELPVYRIQLFALKSAIPIVPRNFSHWTNQVECTYTDGLFKYFVGHTNVYEEILTLQDSLRVKFPDCFVVAFFNSKPIKVSEAVKIK